MNLSDVDPTGTLSELIDDMIDEAESVLCEDTLVAPDTLESDTIHGSISIK